MVIVVADPSLFLLATSVWLVGRSDVMSEDFNLFRIRASPEEKMVIGCLLPMFCSPPRADSTTVSQLVRWFFGAPQCCCADAKLS